VGNVDAMACVLVSGCVTWARIRHQHTRYLSRVAAADRHQREPWERGIASFIVYAASHQLRDTAHFVGRALSVALLGWPPTHHLQQLAPA